MTETHRDRVEPSARQRRPLRIGLFGATTPSGSSLLVHLLNGFGLQAGDEILLVGRGQAKQTTKLQLLQSDLQDAFDTGEIGVTVCPNLRDLRACDVFIMAGGETATERVQDLRELAEQNYQLFTYVAKILSTNVPRALVLIATAPIELGVQVFAQIMSRYQVIGIGAQQDSNRFARAIAAQLGVPRNAIRASVLGGHSLGPIPAWSTAHIISARSVALASRGRKLDRSELSEHPMGEGDDRAVRDSVASIAPATQAKIDASVTARIAYPTPNATAVAILDCLAAAMSEGGPVVNGQVLLDGEFEGIQGVFGVPLAVQLSGWHLASGALLSSVERDRIREVSTAINEQYLEYAL